MAQATRSTDPRRHTPQFQAYQEDCTIRSLDDMRLESEIKAIPQPMVICNDYLSETSSDRLRHTHPHPPTPPRPSQKRLGEEEQEAHWDEDGTDEGASDSTSDYEIRNKEATAREGSQVDDDKLEEDTAEDCPKGEDSPQSNRLYTQEELLIITRKIFRDEDEEDDAELWDDADEAPWATINNPGKDEGAGMDRQDQKSDAGGQSGESEGKVKLDGLFGPTSNVSLSTSSSDGLPCSHQDEDDGQDVEVVQDVLEAVAGSASMDTSDGVNSWTDDTPPSATTSTPLTSPEFPRTALHPSPPTQHPPPPESGVRTLSTIDDASIGNLQPGELPEAHTGANGGSPDSAPVPTTQVDPSEELEPHKPAVVIPSEEDPNCNTIRHIIRKRHLPEFSPTRPGIFSAVIISSSDDASLGKRKRSREDDGDDGERVFSPASVSRSNHQVPRRR